VERSQQKTKPHVFFVDDEPKICKVTQETLERAGMAVECFADGSECLVQLSRRRCDLLIMDMQMPGMGGIELLIEAKRIAPKMPVLIVTSYADSSTASAAIEAGAEYVIEKPLYKKSFLLKVRSLLNVISPTNPSLGWGSSERPVRCSHDKNGLRERILDVATTLFAEDGFHKTTIREIARRAHCNISAANYHFHGKENLYVEVFRRQMQMLAGRRLSRMERELSGRESRMNVEALIGSFAEIFLESFVADARGSQVMRLMMHEKQEPHLPQGLFLREVIQPVRRIMRQALVRACPQLSQTNADLCLHSIVAQLLNLLQAQDLFKGLDEKEMPLLNREKSLEHIVRFSVGGIRQYLDCSAKTH